MKHEMVLDTMRDLKEHAEMMRKHPGMEHDEPHMVHVARARPRAWCGSSASPGSSTDA